MAKFSFRWLRIIGVLLFIWIAAQIDWQAVWLLLKDVQPAYVLGYFAVFMLATMLKVVRLKWFLYCLGHRVVFKDVYKSVMEPAFYGMITPARVGEFSRVGYLMQFGLSQSQAWGVVLMERLVDLLVLMVTSVAGICYFIVLDGINSLWSAVLFLVMVAFVYICLYNINGLTKPANQVFEIIGIDSTVINNLSSLGEKLGKLGRLSAATLLPCSLVILITSFLQLWLLGLGLGLSVSVLYLGMAYASSSLVSLLPLSVGGLGTREAVYITLLQKQGISANAAITISLLDGLALSIIAQVILLFPILVMRTRSG